MPISYNAGAINLDINVDLKDVSGNDVHPFLDRLPKYTTPLTQVKWNSDLGGSGVTGEAVTVNNTAETANSVIAALTLPIGDSRLRSSFIVPTQKMSEARASGQGELADMLAISSRQAIRQIVRSLAAQIFTGAGNAASGGVVGLAQLHTTNAAGRATNTYAGQATTGTGIRWSNYINTNATPRALSSALLFNMSEEILGGVTLGTSSNYTAIFCHPATATAYKGLFQLASDLSTAIGGVADLGYSGLSFEGRPIFVSPYCPVGTMYFIDESELGLYTLVEGQDAFADESGEAGINFKIVEMARTNPDAVQFDVVLKAQLAVMRRPAVAILNQLS